MKGRVTPTILATGFGPFPGAPKNPTAWLMADLRGWSPPNATLVTHVLDVHYDVWNELAPLLETHRPDAVVAFGLSAKATGFTIEHTARNAFDPRRPDARGRLPKGERIAPDGPATYASTLLLDALAHPHVRSDDAGDYICNLTLYQLLANGHRATFVHVPMLAEDELRAGARAVVEAAARATSSLLFPAR